MTKTKTHYPSVEVFSPEEFDGFRSVVYLRLHRGVVTVEFTKRDGTLRTMRCTLSEQIIPKVELETIHENSGIVERTSVKTPKKFNPEVRTVYDVEARAWRSFLWSNIRSVTYDIE